MDERLERIVKSNYNSWYKMVKGTRGTEVFEKDERRKQMDEDGEF